MKARRIQIKAKHIQNANIEAVHIFEPIERALGYYRGAFCNCASIAWVSWFSWFNRLNRSKPPKWCVQCNQTPWLEHTVCCNSMQ